MVNIKRIIKDVHEVYVEVTTGCNFDCSFCINQEVPRPKGMITYESFVRVIDELKLNGFKCSINFSILGESLLHPRIVDLVAYATKNGFPTHITTNGSLLDEDKAASLCAAGLKGLSISLQTPDKESHDKHHGTKLDFDLYLDKILKAAAVVNKLEKGPIVDIVLMHTGLFSKLFYSFDKKSDFISDDAGFRKALAEISKRYYALKETALPKMLARKAEKMTTGNCKNIYIDKKVRLILLPLHDSTGVLFSGSIYPAKFGYCRNMINNLSITWDGRVLLCCRDFTGRTNMGNINETSIADIFASKQLQDIYISHKFGIYKHPFCRKCKGGKTKTGTFFKSAASLLYFRTAYYKVFKRFKRNYHLYR